MDGGDLFQDLPPLSSYAPQLQEWQSSTVQETPPARPPPQRPAPLKTAFKRLKLPSSQEDSKPEVSASGKRLSFKTTMHASVTSDRGDAENSISYEEFLEI
ncbi:hypothetical protein ACH5RR_019094 [Cinchona calisaya]|uniref:Uncharacterized protein n=1 Tax=Cinchona calisaya TaxID=153742 RepID=A0ABD2ZRG8_9GENT